MKNQTCRVWGAAGKVTAPAPSGHGIGRIDAGVTRVSPSGPTNAPTHDSPVVMAGRAMRGVPGPTTMSLEPQPTGRVRDAHGGAAKRPPAPEREVEP